MIYFSRAPLEFRAYRRHLTLGSTRRDEPWNAGRLADQSRTTKQVGDTEAGGAERRKELSGP